MNYDQVNRLGAYLFQLYTGSLKFTVVTLSVTLLSVDYIKSNVCIYMWILRFDRGYLSAPCDRKHDQHETPTGSLSISSSRGSSSDDFAKCENDRKT